MNSMIMENGVTFKTLEKNIFSWVCEIGRQFTTEFLERYDRMLMEERDKKKYRHKGYRQTTIKTVYGEVTYRRAVCEVTQEDGSRHFVYLLDETLQLDHVGLISTNMAQLLVKGVTELSYRECAAKVSEMTGQTISAMGVWNVIQSLGEKVCEEEAQLVEEHKKGHIRGKKEVPVLFEEADGVYVRLQGKDRKSSRQDKAEIKVGIAYDGWKRAGKERYKTFGKSVDTSHWIEARQLYEYVLNDMKRHAGEALSNNDELCEKLIQQIGSSKDKQTKSLDKEIREKKARLSEVDNLFQQLYEDRQNGNITERNYQMMRRRYEDEQTGLEQAIKELTAQRAESDKDRGIAEQFSKLIKGYAGIEELSAALLNTLIEKITIGEPQDVDGERIQEVKIYYKFIGCINQEGHIC